MYEPETGMLVWVWIMLLISLYIDVKIVNSTRHWIRGQSAWQRRGRNRSSITVTISSDSFTCPLHHATADSETCSTQCAEVVRNCENIWSVPTRLFTRGGQGTRAYFQIVSKLIDPVEWRLGQGFDILVLNGGQISRSGSFGYISCKTLSDSETFQTFNWTL